MHVCGIKCMYAEKVGRKVCGCWVRSMRMLGACLWNGWAQSMRMLGACLWNGWAQSLRMLGACLWSGWVHLCGCWVHLWGVGSFPKLPSGPRPTTRPPPTPQANPSSPIGHPTFENMKKARVKILRTKHCLTAPHLCYGTVLEQK